MKTLKYMPPERLASTENSIGKILSHLEPGSRVLECGCASGYTTKYMRDKLGCEVWIVEYDRDAYDIAINYAVDGVCGDLMAGEWTQHFRGMKFDYIMFVDVLEHLYDPSFVLTRATALLDDNGEILVSLPNVTNSDVIAKMLNGSFEYKPTGLLDETHIRFFGPKDLEPFFAQANLGITMFDCTISRLFGTEQRVSSEEIDERVVEVLSSYAWGNVYQFVIAAKKMSVLDKSGTVPLNPPLEQQASFFANLFYAGEQEAFSPTRCVSLSLGIDGILEATVDISDLMITRVRIDPVEGIPCLVNNLCVEVDGIALEPIGTNGGLIDSTYVFVTKDPQLIFELPPNSKALTVHACVSLVFGKNGLDHVKLLDIAAKRLKAETQQRIAAERQLVSQKSELVGLNTIAARLDRTLAEAEESREKIHMLEDTVRVTKRNNRSIKWAAKHLGSLCLDRILSIKRRNV